MIYCPHIRPNVSTMSAKALADYIAAVRAAYRPNAAETDERCPN